MGSAEKQLLGRSQARLRAPRTLRNLPTAADSGEFPVPAELAAHWAPYLAPTQEPSFSAEEHGTWRDLLDHTLRQVEQVQHLVHPAYVAGLDALLGRGPRIPRFAELDERLAPLGWRTIAVTGYLPPKVYADMLAHRALPISQRMRRRCHVDFSPTPDLAHDLLGHVPMLVEREHRRFLQRIAEQIVCARASTADRTLYLANRCAAQLQTDGDATPEQLREAERRVARAHFTLSQRPSALTHLNRLYLWTVEFGIFRSDQSTHAYGAGLLSSPAELGLLDHAGEAEAVVLAPLSRAALHRDISFSEYQRSYFYSAGYSDLHALLDQLGSTIRPPPMPHG